MHVEASKPNVHGMGFVMFLAYRGSEVTVEDVHRGLTRGNVAFTLVKTPSCGTGIFFASVWQRKEPRK